MTNVCPTSIRSLIRGAAAGVILLSACGSSPSATLPATGVGGALGTGAGGNPATGGAGGAGGGGADGGGATTGGGDDGGPVPARNPVADHGQLKVVGTQLQDASGNPVQLKGVSSQWLNYETMTFPESKAAIEYARDHWKLSVIRAAMGVNVSGGYLGTGAGTNANKAGMQSKVETMIQNAIDLGIYVIVDWHTSTAVTATATQATQASAFFSDLATRYGDKPNIIYETYNEPNGVTWAQIKPYHQTVVDAIRQVDPDNLIVLGTPTFSQDVDIAALDPVAGTNLLYTLHFYACTHKQSLRDKGTLALSHGIALFITEFGITPADGGVIRSGDPYVCDTEGTAWFDWMAQNNISGASWKLDVCTDTSCILAAGAPLDGPWTDDFLTNEVGATPVTGGVQPPSGGGHGLFVVNWIRQ